MLSGFWDLFCYPVKYWYLLSLELPHLFLICIVICCCLPSDVQQPQGKLIELVAFTVTCGVDTKINCTNMAKAHTEVEK